MSAAVSTRRPHPLEKPFTFDVQIQSGTVTETGRRTVSATGPEIARRVLQASLAVVYGATHFKITSDAREGTR